MSKAWQLCVVDRTLTDFSMAPNFAQQVMADATTSIMKDGTVVFVVGIIVKSFSSLPSAFAELKASSKYYAIPDGVVFANVWNPSLKKYGWIMRDFLRPILSEQDAVEAEMKFGVNLKNFI